MTTKVTSDNDGCPKHHFSVYRNGVMDTRDWHILWGVPPKYDNESNGALDDNATLAANVFSHSLLQKNQPKLIFLFLLYVLAILAFRHL